MTFPHSPLAPVPAPAPPPWASMFSALGPVGSVITSLVLSACAAAAGWMASKGYIQGADTVTVAALLAAIVGTTIGIAYKAVSSRMAAKIAAVAAAPEVAMVVTTPAVATSPEHAADAKVLSPKDATDALLGKSIA